MARDPALWRGLVGWSVGVAAAFGACLVIVVQARDVVAGSGAAAGVEPHGRPEASLRIRQKCVARLLLNEAGHGS